MTSAALPFRVVRAAAFAVVCLGLSTGAHVLAGGMLSGRSVGLGLAVAFAAAAPLSGRERTLRTILPLLGGVQVALHLLFSMGPAAMVSHAHAGHVSYGGLTPSLGMLIAHAWAAGLTAIWLARGEAALWRLVRGLAVRLVRLLAGPQTPGYAPPVMVRADRERPLRSATPRHAISRRGPPSTVPVTSVA
ncbi:MFS transporter [Thermopolyspora sp. NPDC052614]|uniref:MFS transporter n=1 Tax=Thermopolyspora sp. NPDC052614 TaxID=3155682 RepID=UPI003434F942